jgi:hypothetical protein
MNLSDATIGQVLILVDDFERGVAFDRDPLGLPFRFAAPPKMAFFTCGAIRLLVGVVAPGQAGEARFGYRRDERSRGGMTQTRLYRFVRSS